MLTVGVEDLVARGKTRQEIAKYIGADDVIFLDLDGKDGLKAACIEAAGSTSKVEDFEVGVFCGTYITEVPEGYLDRLSEIRSGKPEHKAGVTNIKAGGDEGSIVASSGPVIGPSDGDEADALRNANGAPEHQEDIRYVDFDIKIALGLLTNVLIVFITWQVNLHFMRNRGNLLDNFRAKFVLTAS